jgi:hypothetical protein
LEKESSGFTTTEKALSRAEQWKCPQGVQFASAAARQAYLQRVQMLLDAFQLRKPERVPIHIGLPGFYPFAYAGLKNRQSMYDHEKLGPVMLKFHADFLPDTLYPCALYGPGPLFDQLDYKLYRWPGHGLPDTATYQYVEDEYMRADEYDRFIKDPSDFFLRYYLPRTFAALASWKELAPLTDIMELPFTGGPMSVFGLPEVQESFNKLLQAGRHALAWKQACQAADRASISSLGLPVPYGGATKAPFDTLGDTLRGTRGIILDRFRQPKKLLAALDRLVPIAVEMGVRAADSSAVPMVFLPLHKGADGFMSQADFDTFYWPTLKAVILGLIQEGVIPYLYVEGAYNDRLHLFPDPDIPAGKTFWVFDKTDMKEVKRRFSGWACFGGNVPASLLKVGKPEEVSNYVKRLIDDVAHDGGYILCAGSNLDDVRPENLHAMIDTGKEYGRYK